MRRHEQPSNRGMGTVYLRQLEGVGELVDLMRHAKKQQELSGLPAASLVRHGNSDGDWAGTRSMEEAVEQARYGWAEGRRYLQRAIGRLAIDRLVGQRHDVRAVPGHAGDEVDIDAYLRGQPEQMIGYQLCHDQQGKQATMLVNCSLPSRVSAERIMRRGGALYAAIEALRADGYSLGLTMAEASCPDFARQVAGVEYRVPVVHPGDYLDVDTAAFCLANPAFLRRGVFAVNEHESNALRREMGFHREGGYGTPTALIGINHQIVL